jgi:hypothetical protein
MGNLLRGRGGFVPHVVGGLATWTVGDLVDRRRLADLLTAEPPVVFVRVVLPVLEAPIRRGFALSHVWMLTLSCSAVSIAATAAADQRLVTACVNSMSFLFAPVQAAIHAAVAVKARSGGDTTAMR